MEKAINYKKSLNQRIGICLLCLLSIFCFAICFLSISQTSFYKKDFFGYNVFDFYNLTYKDNDHPVVLNISSENGIDKTKCDNVYRDLNQSLICNDIREIIDPSSFSIIENEKCSLLSQITFSIKETGEIDRPFCVDGGNFYTYYGDDILGYRGYLEKRGGSDTFVFISESFADELVQKYNIESDKPYEELIKNDFYCFLNIFNGQKTIKVCINNVIKCNEYKAERVTEVHGDKFGLIFIDKKIEDFFKINIEIEFKPNPYTIDKCIQVLSTHHIFPPSYIFSFLSFNHNDGKYTVEEGGNISIFFENAYVKSNNDVIWLIVFGISFLSSLALQIFLTIKSANKSVMSKNKMLCWIFFVVAYGLITSFVYTFWLFGLITLAFLLYSIIEYLLVKAKSHNSLFGVRKKDNCYEISI